MSISSSRLLAPYIPDCNPLLIQAAISQWRREPLVVGILHAQVPKCMLHLRDTYQLPRDSCLVRNANGDGFICGMVLCREQLQPVARYFLACASDEDAAILSEVLANIECITGQGLWNQRRESNEIKLHDAELAPSRLRCREEGGGGDGGGVCKSKQVMVAI